MKTVETEAVVFEDFPEFSKASPGTYKVVLRTNYNVDVEDYFQQQITVLDRLDPLPFVVGGIILLAGLGVFFLSKKKKK
jgi:LPXTG-motif cell wall-anchored protein